MNGPYSPVTLSRTNAEKMALEANPIVQFRLVRL